MTPQHLTECLDKIAEAIWSAEQHYIKRNDARWEAQSELERTVPRLQAFAALAKMRDIANGVM